MKCVINDVWLICARRRRPHVWEVNGKDKKDRNGRMAETHEVVFPPNWVQVSLKTLSGVPGEDES